MVRLIGGPSDCRLAASPGRRGSAANAAAPAAPAEGLPAVRSPPHPTSIWGAAGWAVDVASNCPQLMVVAIVSPEK